MKRSICQDRGAAEKKACVECASVDQLLVRPSQVPEYLRESEFFKSLNTEDDEEFDVPVRCMKANMTVETLQDACDLFGTSRFWGVEISLSSVLQFAVSQSLETIQPALSVFTNEFPVLNTMFYILDDNNSPEERMEAAMGSGVIDLVAHMERTVREFTMKSLASAAAGGHVACLQYALKKPGLGTVVDAQCIYDAAVQNGQLDSLKVLEESHLSISAFREHTTYLPPWAHCLANIAATHGHLHCLQYLQSAGFGVQFYICLAFAAAGGHLSCLQYLVANCTAAPYVQNYKSKALMDAVKADQVDCVRYLHNCGCPLTSDLCHIAACHGSIRSLQFLHENGCVWDQRTCYYGARNGHLECLKYAVEHGCLLVLPSVHSEQMWLSFNMQEKSMSLVESTAWRQHWDCVEYLIRQGFPLTRHLTAVCARFQRMDLVKLVVKHGGSVAVSVAAQFAKAGDMEGLAFAFNHGCYRSTQIMCAAAKNGQLECLKYASELGCRWSAEVCEAAARGGELECLMYARAHGCPWNGRVLKAAREVGRDDILEYAKVNKCPTRRPKGR